MRAVPGGATSGCEERGENDDEQTEDDDNRKQGLLQQAPLLPETGANFESDGRVIGDARRRASGGRIVIVLKVCPLVLLTGHLQREIQADRK